MSTEQSSLFDRRKYTSVRPQFYQVHPPTPAQTVLTTLPAYYSYLQSGAYSKYTPDDFTSDVKNFGFFMKDKTVQHIQTIDVQQWLSILKQTMTNKTVSRKLSALNNYFNWLVQAKAILVNPVQAIPYNRVTSPLPDILFENECKLLLSAASTDPRTYLLLLLLLETGLKKAELFTLKPIHFDFSDKYSPEVWVKHTDKQVRKDRKLKLPPEIAPVFSDYMAQYAPIDTLFPYTPRFIEQLLVAARNQAKLQKRVTAGILRDTFVVRSLNRGVAFADVLQKIGLSDSTWRDAWKKYTKLASKGI
jgi:site-specific recombinase XerD